MRVKEVNMVIKREKSKVSHLLLAATLFFFLSACLFPGMATFPGTPAGKRLKELLDLFNHGSRQKWGDYMKKNFSEDFLKVAPWQEFLDFYSKIRDTHERFQLKEIAKNATEYQLNAILWSPIIEDWYKFLVKVEPKPPHKIAGINLQPSRPPSFVPPPAKLTDQQIAAELKRYVEKLAGADKFSGTVLLARNGKILFKGAYGLASKRFNVPNRIDTKFKLGSMSKMFAAIATAQLVEKGKLSYQDLVGKYLDSEWVQKETAEKVKIKHLLSHTSGLGSFFNDKFWNSSRLLYNEFHNWKPLVKDDKPKFEPGSRWSYSNTGMLLLGPIIEKVSGQSYYDYVRENIFKPAGMSDSDYFEMDRPVPNLAIGYYKEYTDKGFNWHNNILLMGVKGGPMGGGFSTVEDLFHFSQTLMGNKLVSQKSVALLTTPKPELNSLHYGYGFVLRKKHNQVIFGHGGAAPGISSWLQIFKESGYVYIILSNYSEKSLLIRFKLDKLILR